ncbi:hypothetical protein DO021_21505 [Desulfobacter hydrogenophilus]|uniref:Uncharacterized protein n=1 Tax=Desulfobacter hydrogenophilus TaxID=2291 RepID=A0A328FA15_9BACT|nr:hypothetical protein [Desulfobacter hydrogenophilus]NDY74466.1 hypothetical protein [Desulfobacter hydrogenophilus]QBH14303.1 hypothetical protein EYB58_16100 [Desulfobacter hydrogenophilus]RAL99974.1 hypothetical protein DO021_21505 [Desulfobacter hydrogenophilus]
MRNNLIRNARKINTRNHCLSLSNAMICMDCEHIFSAYNPACTCPKCASNTVVFLAKWVPTTMDRCKRAI